MNPAKRAILKQSTRDAKIKKRLSFAPSVGTDDDDPSSGVEGDLESDRSQLSTKGIEHIHPKNLQKSFEAESVRIEHAQQDSGEETSPVFRSRRSLASFQKVDSSNVAPANESITFCPNIKRTSWGLCYVRKDRVREDAEPGKSKSKVPATVAFKDNTRAEFVNAMNIGTNTLLKILIVGEKTDGEGIVIALQNIAAKNQISVEISLCCEPTAKDIKGTHYYIFLVPLERSTCTKALSSMIPKLEKKTACLNLNSCILLLPSFSLPNNSCDTLCPEDLTNLLEQYQMNSYTWPQDNNKADMFCIQLLTLAEGARGATLGSSNLINWGLQRISIVDETAGL